VLTPADVVFSAHEPPVLIRTIRLRSTRSDTLTASGADAGLVTSSLVTLRGNILVAALQPGNGSPRLISVQQGK